MVWAMGAMRIQITLVLSISHALIQQIKSCQAVLASHIKTPLAINKVIRIKYLPTADLISNTRSFNLITEMTCTKAW
jgi:hypothetical protein